MSEVKNKIYDCLVLVPFRKTGGSGGMTPAVTMVLALVWLGGLVGCMAWINHYSDTPGPTGLPPVQWPAGSQIPRDARQPTLVLFAHPQCPCTAATMGELDLLMAQAQGHLHAQVWFLKPDPSPDDWTNSGLWRAAAAIPGVSVHEDRNGREARRFQAGISGQVLLYATNGQLLFQGGITASRGHSGDNAGRSAITALVQGEPAVVLQTPVFGCSLFDTNCKTGGVAWQP